MSCLAEETQIQQNKSVFEKYVCSEDTAEEIAKAINNDKSIDDRSNIQFALLLNPTPTSSNEEYKYLLQFIRGENVKTMKFFCANDCQHYEAPREKKHTTLADVIYKEIRIQAAEINRGITKNKQKQKTTTKQKTDDDTKCIKITLMAFHYEKSKIKLSDSTVFQQVVESVCTKNNVSTEDCQNIVATRYLPINDKFVNIQVNFYMRLLETNVFAKQLLATREFFNAIYFFMKIHMPENKDKDVKYLKDKLEQSSCYDAAAYQDKIGNCYALSVLNMIRLNENFNTLIQNKVVAKREYLTQHGIDISNISNISNKELEKHNISYPTEWFINYDNDRDANKCPILIHGKTDDNYDEGGIADIQIFAPIVTDLGFKALLCTNIGFQYMHSSMVTVTQVGTRYKDTFNAGVLVDPNKNVSGPTLIYFNTKTYKQLTAEQIMELMTNLKIEFELLGALVYVGEQVPEVELYNHVIAGYKCKDRNEYRIHEQHGIDFHYDWTKGTDKPQTEKPDLLTKYNRSKDLKGTHMTNLSRVDPVFYVRTDLTPYMLTRITELVKSKTSRRVQSQ